jgi:hypothetical protein
MVAKALDGRDVAFEMKDFGLVTPEMALAYAQVAMADILPCYITKFEMMDGKTRTFSHTRPDKSNGSDDARFDADCAALREWGIDPDTVKMAENDNIPPQ